MSRRRGFFTTLGAVWLASSLSLSSAVASGLVVVETPRGSGAAMAQDRLDHRYPAGTRLVFWSERLAARQLRVLSEGLRAVCGPVVSYDGQSVVFAGKAADGSPWQIYETRLQAGHWRMVSSVPGGALDPAVLPDGSVIFSSPVPAGGAEPSQLYAQSLGGKPRQLTFCLLGAADPTVLLDGRILFVSSLPAESGRSAGLSLFTINNDGTEITGFACQHDPPANLRRPRQLPDGRLAFVASGLAPASADGTAEYVRMACPFQSRGKLLPNAAARIRSVEPADETNLLVCAEDARTAWAVYRVPAGDKELGQPLFEEAGWDCVEAVAVGPHQRPMGRITNMDPAKKTGQILCLDVNDTTYGDAGKGEKNLAARVRVLAEAAPGNCRSLGEVAVQTDGSFMAEIPADVAVGFEALDEHGQVLRRVEPAIWVRANENRSCVGCHAAHNRAPHNHRPLAVRVPVPRLGMELTSELAQKTAAK